MHDQQRPLPAPDHRIQILRSQIIQELLLDSKRPPGEADFRFSGGLYGSQIRMKLLDHVLRRRRCADGRHRSHFRNLPSCKQRSSAAETVAYEDLVDLGGLPQARTAGKLRQEGKTYIVQDGDVISIKFNV